MEKLERIVSVGAYYLRLLIEDRFKDRNVSEKLNIYSEVMGYWLADDTIGSVYEDMFWKFNSIVLHIREAEDVDIEDVVTEFKKINFSEDLSIGL